MRYSFLNFIQKHFKYELETGIEAFIRDDNERADIHIEVTKIQIRQIDTSALDKYDDYVELPMTVAITIVSEEEGTEYRRKAIVIGKMSGTFSKMLSDFKFCCSRFSKGVDKKISQKYTDELIPIISSHEECDKEAWCIINTAWPRVMEYAYKNISPTEMAHCFGMKVYFARLSEFGTTRGAFIFEDTDVCIYDDTLKCYKKVRVSANTILIEKNLKGQMDVVRYTISHEIFHGKRHKFAYFLRKMYTQEESPLNCPMRISSTENRNNDFMGIIERQADAVAACMLMPNMLFSSLVEKVLKEYGNMPTAYCLQDAFEIIAKLVIASASATRKRLLECGFQQFIGISNYIDDHFVEPYQFKMGALKTGQTFLLSKEQLKKILSENRKIKKYFLNGTLVFAENHLVLNSSDYVKRDCNGYHLTDYAREHLDECAYKFNLQYSSDITEALEYSNIFYRHPATLMTVKAILADNNISVEQKAQMLKERNNDITEISKKISRDIPSSIAAVVDWCGISRTKLVHDAWTDTSTLSKICNNDNANPSTGYMVRLCIAMKLPMQISIILLDVGRWLPRAIIEESPYYDFIADPTNYTVEECNMILEMQGLPTLGGKNPDL